MNEYSAMVTRYKEVVVSGYNENGEFITWNAKDWNARIVQHEMDHLEGKIFIDKMQSPESLEFNYWSMVNNRGGNFRLSFGGVPGWKQYSYLIPIIIMIPLLPLIIGRL